MGWPTSSANEPVQPESMFRIASVSKPLTAVAILRLAELDRLDLDTPVRNLLPDLQPAPDTPDEKLDPRWQHVTVRQLLQHTGGWDSAASFDPMFRSPRFRRIVGISGPADSRAVIRYMLARPLDFNPGEKYAYSNFGYCLLGRVIEAAAHSSYNEALQKLVLEPCGMRHTLGAFAVGRAHAGRGALL